MKPKSKIFLYDFELSVPRCEIHLKFPCTFFLTWTQGKNSTSTAQSPILHQNSIIPFNARLTLSCEVTFDCARNEFDEKLSSLVVHLTSIVRPNEEPKLAGYMKIDLSKCINTNQFETEKKYQLERCPDKNSSVVFSMKAVRVKEIIPAELNERSISQLQKSSSSKSLNRDEDTPTFRLTNPQLNQLGFHFNRFSAHDKTTPTKPQHIQLIEQKTDIPKITITNISNDNQSQTERNGQNALINDVQQKQKEGVSLAELMTKYYLLDKQLQTQKESKKILLQENKILRQEIKKRQTQKYNFNSQLEQHKQEKMKSQMQIANMQTKYLAQSAQKDKKIAQLQRDLIQKLGNPLPEQIALYQARISELEQQLSGNSEHDPKLRSHTNYLREKQNSQLKTRLIASDFRIKQLMEDILRLQPLARKAQHVDTERHQHFEALKILENIIKDKTIAIKELEEILRIERQKRKSFELQLNSKQVEWNEQNKLFDKLKEQLKKTEYNYHNALQDLKYFEEKQELLKKNLQELEKSSGTLLNELQFKDEGEAELQVRVNQLQTELVEASIHIKFLKNQVEQRNNLVKIFEQDLHDIREENNSFQIEVENLQKELKQTNEVIKKQREQKSTIEINLIEALETANLYRKQLDESFRQSRKYEAENAKYQGTCQGLETLVAQLRKDVQKYKQQSNELRGQIRSRQVAIRELERSMTDFVHEGHLAVHNKTETLQAISIQSASVHNSDKDTVNKLKREVRACKAQIQQLNQELFAQSSVSNGAEIKYDELNDRHKALQKQLKLYEKKFDTMVKAIEDLTKQIVEVTTNKLQKSQQVQTLKNELNESKELIGQLRESEKHIETKLKVTMEQYADLRQQYCESKSIIAQIERVSTQNSTTETESQILSSLKDILDQLRLRSEFDAFRVKQLETLTLTQIQNSNQTNKKLKEIFSQKCILQNKIFELSKELNRYKAKSLGMSESVEQKKQIISYMRPFQLKIQQIKKYLKNFLLLNSKNADSNDPIEEEQRVVRHSSQDSKIVPKVMNLINR